MRFRSRIIPHAIVLLLGTIVNVAVAWGCFLAFFAFDDTGSANDDRGRLYAERTDITFNEYALLMASIGEPVDKEAFVEGADFVCQRFGWQTHQVGTITGDVTITVAGWPTDSVHGWRFNLYGPKLDVVHSGAIDIGDWTERSWGFLPYRPLWPGFAINTLLYAGILWLLFAAPFALRRRRRIKRGLCPACAYPTWGGGASDVCTECGRAVQRRKGTTMQ